MYTFHMHCLETFCPFVMHVTGMLVLLMQNCAKSSMFDSASAHASEADQHIDAGLFLQFGHAYSFHRLTAISILVLGYFCTARS